MCSIETIMKAVHQAAEMYPIKRMELFGSYANGLADEKSDVDLLVEFSNQPTTLFQLCGLQETLSELLHKKVDLVELPLQPNSDLLIDRRVRLYGA